MNSVAAAARGDGVSRVTILLAFGCVYFIWGSTYLAIRFAVEVLPPFLMVCGRCLLAGSILYAWARLSGERTPTRDNWRAAAVTGSLLFGGGQSVLAWVEQSVESGVAALVLATIPFWLIVLQLRQKRPGLRTVAGIVLGLGGVVLLVTPAGGGNPAVDPQAGVLLVFCALSWAVGSLFWRSGLPSSSVMTTALQLLAGGVASGIIGAVLGEASALGSAVLTSRSLLAFGYLTVFGTLVTFTAYAWLLRHCEPAAVGSYAFVNPVVAVLIGWAFGGEVLSASTIAAAGIIVSGVYLVVTAKSTRRLPQGEPSRRPAADSPCAGAARGEASC